MSSWSLRGCWRFQRGVLMVLNMVDVSKIHPGRFVLIFKSLTTWKVVHLRCVSRASSWSLRGCWRFLRGVLVVFDMVDVLRILQGSCISIFRSLPVWEVVNLQCVSRASSWSLRGRWRFLRGVLVVFEMLDTTRIHQGSYTSIPSLEVLHPLCVSKVRDS